nr:PREDICTED: protein FAM208B isoform X1 [Lepisosteus oculatus]
MENEKNDTATCEAGLLESVLPGSSTFEQVILPVLQNSYMYPDSVNCFLYNTAYLIKNQVLLEKYDACRTEKKEQGYKDEELKESFGFLLFDNENEAKLLSKTGLQVGHSSCSTLGDPSKGVYISKYSDCLHFSPWYHGKSGCIVAFKVTKGRVKAVTENYTQKYTKPSTGYDCHVSELIETVSSTTSSFQAYERTQYYMYELKNGVAVMCPRHVCPFAIVGFVYGESKPTVSVFSEKSASQDKAACHYYPWRGKIQISNHSLIYHVSLRSASDVITPIKLPEILKIHSVMRISDLKNTLPQSVFETSITAEVFLDGVYCSLYEVQPSSEEDCSLHALIEELKQKGLAFILLLNDCGVLILLPSCFLTFEESTTEKEEILQCLFVFPNSRTVQKEVKFPVSEYPISSDVIQILPGLNYALKKAEEFQSDQNVSPCSLVEQHFQDYVTLNRPGIVDITGKEPPVLFDHFDVPRTYKHLYRATECHKMTVSHLQSYFRNPDVYNLSVSKALELLAVNQEEAMDVEDDHCENVYYSLSSPEVLQSDFWTDGDSHGEVRRSPEFNDIAQAEHAVSEDEMSCETKIEESQERFLECVVVLEGIEKTGTAVTCKEQLNPKVATPTKPISGDMPTDHDESSTENGLNLLEPTNEKVTLESLQDAGKSPITESTNVSSSGDTNVSSGKKANYLLRKDVLCAGAQQKCTTPTRKASSKRITRNSNTKLKILKTVNQKITRYNAKGKNNVSDSHPPKRKMKGDNSYGLKNIITDCGKVFIPHGSSFVLGDFEFPKQTRIATEEDKTLCEEKMAADSLDASKTEGVESQDSGEVADPDGPDKLGQHVEDESRVAPERHCDRGEEQGKALQSSSDVSQFVRLRKRKKPLCPLRQKATAANPEDTPVVRKQCPQKKKRNGDVKINPELVKVGPVTHMDTNTLPVDTTLSEQTSKPEEGAKAQICERKKAAKVKDSSKSAVTSEDLLKSPKSTTPPNASPEMKKQKILKPFKKRMKNRIPDYVKENGWLDFETSDSFDTENIAQTQSKELRTTGYRDLVRSENTHLSATNHDMESADICQSSDALTLLADLALSSSSKVLIQEDQSQNVVLETEHGQTRVGDNGTMQQTLLSNSTSPKLLRSPFPQGLAVTEELILNIISKEHSYSLPPSYLLLGLAGVPPSVSTDCAESSRSQAENMDNIASVGGPLLLRNKEAPYHEKSRKEASIPENEQECHSDGLESRSRLVFEKNGVLYVSREWKEEYDFKLDSKFTNDPLDKTVARALHGPWDCNIEESYEQVHLILHMWIGLFYSRSTMRFFQTDPSDSEDGDQNKNGPEMLPVKDVSENDPSSKSSSDEQDTFGTQPSVIQLPLNPHQGELLDLREESKKEGNHVEPNCGAVDVSRPCDEVLDLSVPKRPQEDLSSSTSNSEQGAQDKNCFTQSRIEGSVKDTQVHHTDNLSVGTGSYFVDKISRSSDDMSDTDINGEKEEEDDVYDDNPEMTDMTKLLGTDSVYIELCNRIANLCISKRKQFNGLHRTLAKSEFPLSAFHLVNVPTVTGDRMEKTRNSYVQEGKLSHITLKLTETLNSVSPDQSCIFLETESSSDQFKTPSTTQDGHDTNNVSKPTETINNVTSIMDLSCSKSKEDHASKYPEIDSLPCGIQEQGNERLTKSVEEEKSADCQYLERDLHFNLSDKSLHREDQESTVIRNTGFLDQKQDRVMSLAYADAGEKSQEGGIMDSQTPEPDANSNCSECVSDEIDSPVPSTVTMSDCWGVRKTYDNYPVITHRVAGHIRTVQNEKKEDWHLKSFLEKWEQMHRTKPDLTQASLDLEYLIFSEKIHQILKKTRSASPSKFSSLSSWRNFSSVADNSIFKLGHVSENSRDMPLESDTKEVKDNFKPLFSSKAVLCLKKPSYVNGIEEPHEELSNISEKCSKSYRSTMNAVCSGTKFQKQIISEMDKEEKDFLQSKTRTVDFFHKLRFSMFDCLHTNLNSVVRQSLKTKYRFFILETKVDTFFEKTKEALKAEGHVGVQPSQFSQLDQCSSSPLLMVIRNEDISANICKIPHLLDLKKMPDVLFAGVDCPDDILNCTYQELFTRGGFVVCDGAVLDTLTLDHFKKMVSVLEEQGQNGKWKWFLHYKDCRRLKENGRTSIEDHTKQHFIDCCQEADIVEVLPYHECDLISQERPDYFSCLLRLQVQHVTARFAVFITDKPEDTFGKHGILATNINTFFYIFQSGKT